MAGAPDLRVVFSTLSASGCLTDRSFSLALTTFQVPIMAGCALTQEERETACKEVMRLVTRSDEARVSYEQFSAAVEQSAVFRKLADEVRKSHEAKQHGPEESWDEDAETDPGPIAPVPVTKSPRPLQTTSTPRVSCLARLKRLWCLL